jgi:hypothetical protein
MTIPINFRPTLCGVKPKLSPNSKISNNKLKEKQKNKIRMFGFDCGGEFMSTKFNNYSNEHRI